MVDEETSTPQDNNTQPLEVDPASAVAAFIEWLQNREIPAGPFSAHYNAEAGNALVKQFCDAQGWTLEETQVQQVVALRTNYPA